MKRDFFLRALSDVDPALISEADRPQKPRRPATIWKYGGLAACFLLVAGVIFLPRVFRDTLKTTNDDAVSRVEMNENAIYDADVYLGETGDQEDCVITEITFRFCEEDGWRTETWDYPSEIPDGVTLLNEYLAAAGTDVRCVSLEVENSEQTELVNSDGSVQYICGTPIEIVTLDGNPGENILRGLVNTIVYSEVFYPRYVRIQGPDGALPIDGSTPESGFSGFPESDT